MYSKPAVDLVSIYIIATKSVVQKFGTGIEPVGQEPPDALDRSMYSELAVAKI